MRIGVPAEVKPDEYRVALTPAGAHELVRRGHEVRVERGAGLGSGLADAAYERVGAALGDAADAWGCDLVLKVKEPQPGEFGFLRDDQTLFTYLHLAANAGVADALRRAGTTAIAYETVEDAEGRLPLLAPMSEIAGRLAVQAGARYLERPLGGRGVLLGGVAGVAPGSVVIIGAGIVGVNAAIVAAGMQAHVTVLDVDLGRLRRLEMTLAGRVTLLHSTRLAIEELLPTADLVVGAVLVPGARAPRLVEREALATMRPGSVVADVAVDQGGCFATSRPTTHSDPVFVVDGVVHYCVANMPGAVPVTATRALSNATLPYVTWIAEEGVAGALRAHAGLRPGVNVRDGKIVNAAVAEALAI
ncbi:alanine dehydrogenase [Miltoncostaea marina]|uniref:alanine dehydrogenase n=1 Tax=Miltoncostaea marina TaxID=2843215 RepID=UPI001C3E3FE1|nr:alanine dehydrogenase [Miltoncostaea marina]